MIEAGDERGETGQWLLTFPSHPVSLRNCFGDEGVEADLRPLDLNGETRKKKELVARKEVLNWRNNKCHKRTRRRKGESSDRFFF